MDFTETMTKDLGESTYETDRIYLDSRRHLDRLEKKVPLEIHNSLFRMINDYNFSNDEISVLDIGCGLGEFLGHCNSRNLRDFSKIKLTGIEKSAELAEFCVINNKNSSAVFYSDSLE